MRFSAKIIVAIIVLISIIIGSGIYSFTYISKGSERLTKSIDEIEDFTQRGDWDRANSATQNIYNDWNKTSKIWSMLIDHIEVDNIETSLTKMSKYIELKESVDALTEISTLKQFIKHIPKKESFSLKNIF